MYLCFLEVLDKRQFISVYSERWVLIYFFSTEVDCIILSGLELDAGFSDIQSSGY